VRVDILDNMWSPAWTLRSILISLRAFLRTPDTEIAVEWEIAEEVEQRREEFERKTVEWTFRYAVEDWQGDVQAQSEVDAERALPLKQEASEDDWFVVEG
jgi:hypothetical protein